MYYIISPAMLLPGKMIIIVELDSLGLLKTKFVLSAADNDSENLPKISQGTWRGR